MRCPNCEAKTWHCDCSPCPACGSLLMPWEQACGYCVAEAKRATDRRLREEEERDGGR